MREVARSSLAVLVSYCILFTGMSNAVAYQEPQALDQSPEQLQQLVAPIALYPDSLIAQIMAAATYPAEIVEAEKFLEKHKDWQGKKLADEVNKQHWDPSVKSLTQFPAVLANMNQNLAWTSELGDAYLNQGQQLNQAIQTLREKAKAAGNLKSTPQQNVTTQGNTIMIQPAAPDVVYVPQYDPWLVYGYPIAAFPGWYPWPGLYLDGLGIGWGLGFGIGFFGGFGWGWGNWGYNWHGGSPVIFNHNTFISHSSSLVSRDFRGAPGFRDSGDFRAGGFDRGDAGMRSGAFSSFDHGGFARQDSFRGAASFGGFHGGGFGGGFHGGGGRR